MSTAQVHVEKSAKAVRRQRADAEKAAAQAHSDRLAEGSTQREPLPSRRTGILE